VALARAIAASHGFVGIAFLNEGFADTAHSWLCNVEAMSSPMQFTLLIATDAGALAKLLDWRRAHNWTVAVAQLGSSLRDSFAYMQAGYWTLIAERVRLLNALVDSGVDFLLFETDAVWFECAFTQWMHQRSAASQIDVWGIRDGSQASAIGFGFLGVRANARVQRLWKELTRRFDASVAPIAHLSPHALIDEAPKSEQFFLSQLIAQRFEGVQFEFLPSARYTNGMWYQREQVRHDTSVTPAVINLNWIVGVAAKIQMAKDWGHWFVDDNGQCSSQVIARLAATTTREPRRRLGRAAIHQVNCPCSGMVGSPCWCRCCANDAGGYRDDCRRAGFCSTLCGAEFCAAANVSFVDDGEPRCLNRFLFLQSDDARMGARDRIAQAARTLALAAELDLIAVVRLPWLSQHLTETHCVLTQHEAAQLHPMISTWQNVAFHGATVRRECRNADECFVRKLPSTSTDVVASDRDRESPLLVQLQRILRERDPMLLVVHDFPELDLSGIETLHRAIQDLEPLHLLHQQQQQQQQQHHSHRS
jgi:hypothetical protein